MHLAIRRSLWSASRQPARLVAGRRHSPRPVRTFTSTSTTFLDIYPWDGQSPDKDRQEDNGRHEHSEIKPPNAPGHAEVVEAISNAESAAKGGRGRNGAFKDRHRADYGSGVNRARRNKRPKNIPEIRIPLEFMESKVRLYPDDEPLARGVLHLSENEVQEDSSNSEQKLALDPDDIKPEDTDDASRSEWPQYSLHSALMSEVLATLSAGLAISHPESSDATSSQSFANQKAHLKLLCPIDGGIYFLDKIVEDAAQELGADLISLDPQTIAETAGDYINEGSDATSNSLWTLGYDTAQIFNRTIPSLSLDDEAGSEEMDEDQDRASAMPFGPRLQTNVIPFSQAPSQLQDAIKNMFLGGGNPHMSSGDGARSSNKGIFHVTSQQPNAQWNELKLTSLLETLVSANSHKQELVEDPEDPSAIAGEKQTPSDVVPSDAKPASDDATPAEGSEQAVDMAPTLPERKRIVLLKDFKEMKSTVQGGKLIDKLIDIIRKKRLSGQRIVLVGTTSTSDLAQSNFNTVENLQSEDAYSVFRTLVITPNTDRGLYHQEEGRRMREINGRHIYSMIKRLQPQSASLEDAKGSAGFAAELHEAFKGTERTTYLEDGVLTLDEVHRIVFTALGQIRLKDHDDRSIEMLRPDHILAALDLIEKSDEAKSKWAQTEHQLQNLPEDAAPLVKDTATFEAHIKKLRKGCNQHEKNLLRGVINPQSISTAFTDVHAAPDTIEALKNLTTLSLTRPEAFKYGVLAKDKINGLLLYGPPGTGKTLLAKAVAKESGATMLEISGSDVYDMYVGEGEKNVRAVFSLAKKLAPCVVFIDEADAIFASRGSGTNRNSHRELINQFLREWDGMNETSAFIMVATNRPFDLDDAALRRLPRRLLVDLPSEKDREAILNIHLKGEDLASEVSLSKLASQTPLYSGSDLKNFAVAAALAAVREENDDAKAYEARRRESSSSNVTAGPADEVPLNAEPYKFPAKRTLTAKHFERAMEEISASVSEDMSSLGAIRKFDEKYGDRRGRKKKTAYGFGPAGSEGVKEEGVKVRS